MQADGNDIKPALDAQDLELSLSHERSLNISSDALQPRKLKTSGAHEELNESSDLDEVKMSSKKSYKGASVRNKSSGENGCGMGLHLGLSVSSFLSGKLKT